MDGWNTEKLEDILNVLDSLYNASYEIRNCIRGCQTGANTYEELQSYLKRKAQQLMYTADWMDTNEDEEEEE